MATEGLAEAHSKHPTRYRQTCQLCCNYVNAFVEKQGAMIFWRVHLEYLHTVMNQATILCDPHEAILLVKVYDKDEMKRIFNALYLISPDETFITMYENILRVAIYEPDILCGFEEEEEEEDIRRHPQSASLSPSPSTLQDARSRQT